MSKRRESRATDEEAGQTSVLWGAGEDHFASSIGHDESRDRLGSETAHGFQAMQAIWSPEDIVGSDHSDDRIEKLPNFVN
jgi:hypothetical protein